MMLLSAPCRYRGGSPHLIVQRRIELLATTRTLYQSHLADRLYCWR